MRAEGWGRLCCISSYSVIEPIPGLALSNTARSGLRPGRRLPPLTSRPRAAASPSITCAPDRMPPSACSNSVVAEGGPIGDPADFGRVVAFVCSAHAGFVNGATIVVDGGVTLAL